MRGESSAAGTQLKSDQIPWFTFCQYIICIYNNFLPSLFDDNISFTPWQILTFIGNAIPSGKLYFIFIWSPFTVSWVCYVKIPSKELVWPGQETPLLLSAASWPVVPIKYKFHTVTPPLPLGDFQGVLANILYKYVNMWEITRFVSKMLFLSFHFYWKANER